MSTRALSSIYAPVALALCRLLPDTAHTRLLRACLDATEGAAAWHSWRAMHDLPATLANDHQGIKGMLPLLAYALERNGATVAAEDLSLLRMARYREELRSTRYQAILQQALDALATAEIPCLVLKGTALACYAYPSPALRHCHDIDLLLHPHQLAHAQEQLQAADFRPLDRNAPRPHTGVANGITSSVGLEHSSGLPVMLHTRLFSDPWLAPPLDAAWRAAVPLDALAQQKTLAAEWELVHILGNVLTTRARVTWVCDTHFLLAARPNLDWARVVEIAMQSGLTLTVRALLDYLRASHGLAVPQATLDALVYDLTDPHQRTQHYTEQTRILTNIRSRGRVTNGELLAAATSWQERAFVLRWMSLPLPPAPHLPLWRRMQFYGRRGIRFMARRIAARRA